MKSFKEYISEENKEDSNLSWEELTPEERKEIEKQNLKDHKKQLKEFYERTGREYEVDGRYDPIHDEIRGYGHHKKHVQAIWDYSSSPKQNIGRSSIINGYLKAQSDKTLDSFEHKHKIDEIKEKINTLSSSFNPKTTVRKSITTLGGVPKRIGEALAASKKNSVHKLIPFTSTTTNGYTALAFAKRYAKNRNHIGEYHMIKYHIDPPKDHQPGNAMSIAHLADLAENEVTLHHGTRVRYLKTTQHPSDDGGTIHVHHVRVIHDDEHKQIS
jgi:DNA-binding transcriptional MerR regulator